MDACPNCTVFCLPLFLILKAAFAPANASVEQIKEKEKGKNRFWGTPICFCRRTFAFPASGSPVLAFWQTTDHRRLKGAGGPGQRFFDHLGCCRRARTAGRGLVHFSVLKGPDFTDTTRAQ